jgi:hypothetical protein
MLNQFGSIWPSMGATMSHDQKMGYVVQLATALTENGLDNGESVREGFRKARTEGGQYLPSVPEFVRWCKVATVEPSHVLLPRLEKTGRGTFPPMSSQYFGPVTISAPFAPDTTSSNWK